MSVKDNKFHQMNSQQFEQDQSYHQNEGIFISSLFLITIALGVYIKFSSLIFQSFIIHTSFITGFAFKFPQIPRQHNLLFFLTYQFKNQFEQSNITLQSAEIARSYIKLGLNEPSESLIQKQKQYYENKYSLRKTFIQDLNQLQFPFCIVIPSYNNVKNLRYKLVLNSIFRQQYQNYHIVYIDDASFDKTGQYVKQYIKEKKFNQSKIEIIINEQNRGALQNQYTGVCKHCSQNQILIQIDGDDGFIGTQTFKLFNHFYQTTDSLFIYGNYIHTMFSQTIGISKQFPQQLIKNRNYRQKGHQMWLTSHPKSTYVKLFKKFDISNLLEEKYLNKNQSIFYQTNSDRAWTYPALQMAGQRIKYIPELLVLYLQNTQYSDSTIHKQQQDRVLYQIQLKKKQPYIKCIFKQSQKENCLTARQTVKKYLKESKDQ